MYNLYLDKKFLSYKIALKKIYSIKHEKIILLK